LAQRHPVTARLSAGILHRFHSRRAWRGNRADRHSAAARHLPVHRRSRAGDPLAGAGQFQPASCRLSGTNFLYLCLCTQRYGLRPAAGGGRAAATGEFRRHLGGHIAERLRHLDVDPYTPQTAWSLISGVSMRQGVVRFSVTACLLGLGVAASHATANDYSSRPEGQTLIRELVAEGLDEQHVRQLLDSATRQDKILEAIAKPAERTLTWGEYRKIFVQDSRIEQGLAFWREHRDLLARAEKEYGVPAEIIIAIVGVETRYGRHKGTWRAVDALATLGFDYPPRADFFRRELKELLLLEREAGIDAGEVVGSYAGALGMPQFIPSSYRAYAVDFNGDGKIDLLNDVADVIGSVAHY